MNSIKVLSLNVQQFPWYTCLSTDNVARAQRLAERLLEHKDEYDVIAFQEMWSNTTRQAVRQHIATEFPYAHEDNQYGKFGLGMHSGLAIYSKRPILAAYGPETFTDYRGPEHFAKKGVMGIKVALNIGVPMNVFTTQLQAGPGGSVFQELDKGKPATTEISGLELKQIRAFIDKCTAGPQAPTLLMGDFNFEASNDNPEYTNIASVLHGVDTFNTLLSAGTSSIWDGDKRIDYIVSMANTRGSSWIVNEFGPDISNHCAVVGEFVAS